MIATRVFANCCYTLRGTLACQIKDKVPANWLIFLHFLGLNFFFSAE